MSLEIPPDLQRLRQAFAATEGEAAAGAAGACLSAEEIFDAAHGGLTRMSEEKRGALLDHLALCPLCGESWRLALEIAREVAPREALFAGGTAGSGAADGGAADGGVVVTGAFGAPPAPLWRRALPIAAGLAALLLAALALPMLLPDGGGSSPPVVRGAGDAQIVDAAEPLDRARCVLRWRLEPAQAGALFTVRAMSETLEIVADEAVLDATELSIPAAKLAKIPPGGWLLWQVQASLPDGSALDSPTFRSRLP